MKLPTSCAKPKKRPARARQFNSTLPRPSKAIARSGKPKAKKRKPSEQLRIYGSPEFRTWLHLQCCATCGVFGYTEQAHAKTGGAGRKDDWERTLPLCGPHPDYRRTVVNGATKPAYVPLVEGCHRASGRGVKTFESKHGVTLLALAERTQQEWQQHVATTDKHAC